MELAGRVAVVTGGSRGIGRETAKTLAAAGARVVATYSTNREGAEEGIRGLGAGRAIAAKADVTDPGSVDRLVADTLARFGRLDILINAASYASPKAWKAPLHALSLEEWDRTIAVDLTGTFLTCRAAAPHLGKGGVGAIVNFSSSAALQGDTDTLLYNAAKVGVVGLTRSLARSLAPSVRVNAIAPGSIQTDWVETWGLREEEVKALADEVPPRRLGTAAEVARVILFLVSDRARHITGQTLVLDGGMGL